MRISESIAKFIVKTKFKDIPTKTLKFTKELALKCTAGMLAGSVSPAGRKILKYVKERGVPPEVRVIGYGLKTSVENAVLADGVFAHASELEDDQFPGGGLSNITIFPAIFPLAEKLKLSGKEFIEAAVIGLEVQNRFGYFTSPRTEEMGIVGLPFFGVIGATAAAAKAFGLDVRETEAALGTAFTQGCGYTVNFGTDAHYLESAFSCRNGVIAAMLAKEGMSSNPDLETWLVNLLGKERVRPENIIKNLGRPPYFVHNIWVKKYPCCFLTHRHIDALFTLMNENKISYEQIESIEVHVGKTDAICDRPDPRDVEDSKFSFQHILAALMLESDLSLNTFTDEKVVDPKFREARAKVKVIVHPNWPSGFLAGIARVSVKLKDGKRFTKEMEQSIGGPKLPLTTEQFKDLYQKYSQAVLSEEQIKSTMDIILNIEKAVDIIELVDVLTSGCTIM